MSKNISVSYRSMLHQLQYRVKKRLGQHFLTNENVVECILDTAELSKDDTVIEVGPGLGILTTRIAKLVSDVIAVELDSKLVSLLSECTTAFPNIKVVHGDILKITPQKLLRYRLKPTEFLGGYKVVANLPYYITNPILYHFLTSSQKPSLMVLMVQKEVGEAMVAMPGKMSFLSVSTQLYSKPRIIRHVPAEDFYPVPKVDSVVLRLDVYQTSLIDICNIEDFFYIVHCGFRAPRKQIHNSLALALEIPPGRIQILLKKASIDPKRRPETLSLQEWKQLYKVFLPIISN